MFPPRGDPVPVCPPAYQGGHTGTGELRGMSDPHRPGERALYWHVRGATLSGGNSKRNSQRHTKGNSPRHSHERGWQRFPDNPLPLVWRGVGCARRERGGPPPDAQLPPGRPRTLAPDPPPYLPPPTYQTHPHHAGRTRRGKRVVEALGRGWPSGLTCANHGYAPAHAGRGPGRGNSRGAGRGIGGVPATGW